ncbi:MAG: hypothetical protein E7J02_08335, partial [Staphylococcus warneri]|nr:hypothetical protein [Staphylococcus warneri]MDU5376105.1 hypothetical protein [Staphylococcus warneri]
NNQKIYKKDNFYIISIEIVFFSLIQELYVPDSFFLCSEKRPVLQWQILFRNYTMCVNGK